MKQRIAEFPTQQEQYLYQIQSDGTAVVFIREFLREEHRENEDGTEEVLFIYNENEFTVDSTEITEEMIADDPLSWIDYDPTISNISIEERITAIEDAVMEMSEVIFND